MDVDLPARATCFALSSSGLITMTEVFMVRREPRHAVRNARGLRSARSADDGGANDHVRVSAGDEEAHDEAGAQSQIVQYVQQLAADPDGAAEELAGVPLDHVDADGLLAEALARRALEVEVDEGDGQAEDRADHGNHQQYPLKHAVDQEGPDKPPGAGAMTGEQCCRVWSYTSASSGRAARRPPVGDLVPVRPDVAWARHIVPPRRGRRTALRAVLVARCHGVTPPARQHADRQAACRAELGSRRNLVPVRTPGERGGDLLVGLGCVFL